MRAISKSTLFLLCASLSACQGGSAVTEGGPERSDSLTAGSDCQALWRACVRQAYSPAQRAACDEQRDACLAAEATEPEPAEEPAEVAPAPSLDDVTLAPRNFPQVATNDGSYPFFNCGIVAGESTCEFDLEILVNNPVRYAVVLAGIGPITGCTEAGLSVNVPWIQSANLESGNPFRPETGRDYEFQAFQCDGDQPGSTPVSRPVVVTGVCQVGLRWNEATHTCTAPF